MKTMSLCFLVAYLRNQDMDCLHGNNINQTTYSEPSDFEQWKLWCTNNDNCGGFTVYRDTAFFKNKDCKNGLFNSRNKNTFIKHEA